MLTVKGTQFYEDGHPFFYLADTCWSAFTNITLDEWNYYLDYRASQGFNTVQINMLSQWDASESDLNIWPFPRQQDGVHYTYDFSQLNETYFDRAEKMIAMVRDHHMTPALVLLWSNFVPGTWAAKMAFNNQMPFDEIEPYVAYVTKRYQQYQPLYFVSGDTDFPTEETVRYYAQALKVAKENDSSALYSFHIKGRLAELPEAFYQQADFFSYQSGHNLAGQNTAYLIPSQLRAQGYTKPIINAEPCYEQISYSRNLYGRYSARDVRQAAWSSVLSGANAGITYGAHGIWSWHRQGKKFGIVEGEGFDAPFDWRDALHFGGADDMALMKQLIESRFSTGLYPVDQNIKNEPSIRVAATANNKNFVLYVPTNTTLPVQSLGVNADEWTAQSFDLNKKMLSNAPFKTRQEIGMSRAEADSIVMISRK